MKKVDSLLKREVAILGANGIFGKITSLLLKQTISLKNLILYDNNNLVASEDLRYIKTGCRVTPHVGQANIQNEVKDKDKIQSSEKLKDKSEFLTELPEIEKSGYAVPLFSSSNVIIFENTGTAESFWDDFLYLGTNRLDDLYDSESFQPIRPSQKIKELREEVNSDIENAGRPLSPGRIPLRSPDTKMYEKCYRDKIEEIPRMSREKRRIPQYRSDITNSTQHNTIEESNKPQKGRIRPKPTDIRSTTQQGIFDVPDPLQKNRFNEKTLTEPKKVTVIVEETNEKHIDSLKTPIATGRIPPTPPDTETVEKSYKDMVDTQPVTSLRRGRTSHRSYNKHRVNHPLSDDPSTEKQKSMDIPEKTNLHIVENPERPLAPGRIAPPDTKIYQNLYEKTTDEAESNYNSKKIPPNPTSDIKYPSKISPLNISDKYPKLSPKKVSPTTIDMGDGTSIVPINKDLYYLHFTDTKSMLQDSVDDIKSSHSVRDNAHRVNGNGLLLNTRFLKLISTFSYSKPLIYLTDKFVNHNKYNFPKSLNKVLVGTRSFSSDSSNRDVSNLINVPSESALNREDVKNFFKTKATFESLKENVQNSNSKIEKFPPFFNESSPKKFTSMSIQPVSNKNEGIKKRTDNFPERPITWKLQEKQKNLISTINGITSFKTYSEVNSVKEESLMKPHQNLSEMCKKKKTKTNESLQKLDLLSKGLSTLTPCENEKSPRKEQTDTSAEKIMNTVMCKLQNNKVQKYNSSKEPLNRTSEQMISEKDSPLDNKNRNGINSSDSVQSSGIILDWGSQNKSVVQLNLNDMNIFKGMQYINDSRGQPKQQTGEKSTNSMMKLLDSEEIPKRSNKKENEKLADLDHNSSFEMYSYKNDQHSECDQKSPEISINTEQIKTE